MSNNSSAAGLCFLIILYLVFFHGDTNSSYEEKTVYFAYCSDFEHNIYSCPTSERTFVGLESFMVSSEKQDVVPRDIAAGNKYKACLVFDKNNWKCETNGYGYYIVQEGKFAEKFPDGKFSKSIDEDGKESNLPRVYQITYIEYIIRHISEYF